MQPAILLAVTTPLSLETARAIVLVFVQLPGGTLIYAVAGLTGSVALSLAAAVGIVLFLLGGVLL